MTTLYPQNSLFLCVCLPSSTVVQFVVIIIIFAPSQTFMPPAIYTYDKMKCERPVTNSVGRVFFVVVFLFWLRCFEMDLTHTVTCSFLVWFCFLLAVYCAFHYLSIGNHFEEKVLVPILISLNKKKWRNFHDQQPRNNFHSIFFGDFGRCLNDERNNEKKTRAFGSILHRFHHIT